ncbi:class I SAM-dependent methyltransferase [Caldovatus aquaticus]|uniref:Methyltransferase domain-containing protein n=1 Tax=Caldovatus aquaticus TaxID=2865671 RepID=A0ABS7EZM6_9PROT|nr:class I SAM-dependent methyltransferase [Caldovatus aquaticus]MBW8268177.1 methyltransferase domain-containing protein [Caldovatus aquaticus]
MTGEVHAGLGAFYATPAGQVAARLVRARLGALWPALHGQSVLGLGHAGPYLDLWRGQATRLVAVRPRQLGLPRHPGGPCRALAPLPGEGGDGGGLALVEEEALPFPDLSFDRVLLIHGLEVAENARRLLREAWRVLKDDGRLLVVVPNRRGLWAHVESTPFGHGQPYSAGQLGRLLARHLFRVERRDAALFLPPVRHRLLLRGADLWERAGRALCPPRFAGLAIVEATKDLFAGQPAGAAAPALAVVAARRPARAVTEAPAAA